jgi:stage II sporulation protein GA (sporulation sigma-E factor processing peptidase)
LLYEGQKIKTRGLIDTGNHLTAPASGIPVHVATAELMKRLCPVVKGVMYVPYRCVGSSGILPAVRIDEMKVEGEKDSFVIPKPWIAITKGSLSPCDEYEVLIQKNDEGMQV